MKYLIVILTVLLMSGCNQLSTISSEQADLRLICEPVEANGCIGFAKDKSIMLITEEEI